VACARVTTDTSVPIDVEALRRRSIDKSVRNGSRLGYWTLVLSACGFRARFFHATKTEMIGASVDFAFAASAHYVARAVLVVAKKRAAAVHALFLVRLGRIEW